MAVDMDNLELLSPAPDIDNFDPKGQDRGDAIVATEPEEEVVVPEPKDEIVEPDEPVETEPVDEDVDPVEDDKPRDEKGKFAPKGIPKARFDEAVGKEREAREAAERRAEVAERQLHASERQRVQNVQLSELEDKITELETKADELLLDGNVAEASKLRKEIRLTERQIARVEAAAVSNQSTTNALESERFDVAVTRLEADHPALNPKSEEYDKRAVSFVLSEQRRLMAEEGLTPSVALTAAAKDVMGLLNSKVEPAAEKEGLANADKAADRKTAQIKKNLDTLKKQPSNLKDVGIDSDKAGQTTQLPDVKSMTQEEFNALPKSTLAKLRGDLL